MRRGAPLLMRLALALVLFAFVLSVLTVARLIDLSFIVPALLCLAAAGLLLTARARHRE